MDYCYGVDIDKVPSELSYEGIQGVLTKLDDQTRLLISTYLANGFNIDKAASRINISKVKARALIKRDRDVRAVIDWHLQNYALDANEVLIRLSEQARADMADFLDDEGKLDLKTAIENGKGPLIKSLKPTKEGMQIVIQDSQRALEILAKVWKIIYDENNNQRSQSINLDALTREQLLELRDGNLIEQPVETRTARRT